MKQIIVGLDLSFNSTGISIGYFTDYNATHLSLNRLVFDDNSRKSVGWKPKHIPGINQQTYRMPTNIDITELSLTDDANDFTTEQVTATIKAMICSKRICKIVEEAITSFEPDEVYFNIEGAITPVFSTANQMRVIAELTMLQGYVREWIVRNQLEKHYSKCVLYITPPNQNKKFFSGTGKGTKDDMYRAFIDEWDGAKILPVNTNSKIDDVIDAFALMVYMYRMIYDTKLSKNNK